MTKRSDENLALAIKLHKQGATYAEIGRRVGIGRQTAFEWLKREGLTESKGPAKFWNDERLAELRRLIVDERCGARRASGALGCAKSTVFNKAKELGYELAGKPGPASAPRKPRAPSVKRDPRANATLAKKAAEGGFTRSGSRPPTVIVHDDEPGSATVLSLESHMCKWPIGEGEGITFCGKVRKGRAYCVEHEARAYEAIPAHRPRTANELARSIRRYL